MSVTYSVSIDTPKMPFAGTDARIAFKLNGMGCWDCEDLEKYVRPYVGRDPFEMGQIDTFPIEMDGTGFGCIDFVEIALQPKCGSWFIEDITIIGISSVTNKNTKWVAHHNYYLCDYCP